MATALVRSTLRLQRALLASGRHSHQQTRGFRQSPVALARRNRRSGGVASTPRTSVVFDGGGSSDRDDEDDEREVREWFEQMQLQQRQRPDRRGGGEKRDFGALAEPDDDDDDDDDSDDDEEDDPETAEFLSEVDELFALEPEAFERKMQAFDRRQENAARHRRAFSHADEEEAEDDDDDDDDDVAEEDDEEDDEDDEEEFERAKERIAKKKLLKVLDAFQPGTSGRNKESITPPKTKNAAPLEKKPKKVNVERVSYRQERVELSVVGFVQNLIIQDADAQTTDVVASIVEASVAPDLRRVVLYWEPQRLNSDNQTISKRKVAGIERRLQTQERWIRAQVTRHLNLKYSPNVQFKQRRTAQSDEIRAKFDREMAWLDRF